MTRTLCYSKATFIATVDSFVFTTRQRRLLALPACRSLRDGDQQLVLQAMLSLSMAVASAEAACAALRRRRGVLCVLNSSAAIAGNAGTPLDT